MHFFVDSNDFHVSVDFSLVCWLMLSTLSCTGATGRVYGQVGGSLGETGIGASDPGLPASRLFTSSFFNRRLLKIRDLLLSFVFGVWVS